MIVPLCRLRAVSLPLPCLPLAQDARSALVHDCFGRRSFVDESARLGCGAPLLKRGSRDDVVHEASCHSRASDGAIRSGFTGGNVPGGDTSRQAAQGARVYVLRAWFVFLLH